MEEQTWINFLVSLIVELIGTALSIWLILYVYLYFYNVACFGPAQRVCTVIVPKWLLFW